MRANRKRTQLYPTFLVLLPVLLTVIVYFAYIQAEKKYRESGIENLETHMNTIVQMLIVWDQEVSTGQKTKIEAQMKAKEFLVGPTLPNGTRDPSKVKVMVGDGDYLFAFNSQGTMVLHPNLEGKNLNDLQNFQGFDVDEFLKNPTSIVNYEWQDPGHKETQRRMSIIRYFRAWDWYIGVSTSEKTYYQLFNYVKLLMIYLVTGSYLVTAILVFLAHRKERLLMQKSRLSEELAQANQSILKSLAVALEERDAYTSGHSQRVAYYMRVISVQMGLAAETVDWMYTGGLLHDIGKIGIEDSILLKAGRLTDEEYRVIKTHPVRGEAILRKLYEHSSKQDSQKVQMILTITRSHHERIDGLGYPDNLKGDELPLVARIAAVADSFDAMTSSRPYRTSLGYAKATQEIFRCAGTQFCPIVVDAFLQSVTEETFLYAHEMTRAEEVVLAPMQSEIS